MKSSYFSEYNRRVNEYKACLNKANALQSRFQGNPVRSTLLEAIRSQRDAAELSGEIANMFDQWDPQCSEWLAKQANHERKLQELLDIYENGIPEITPTDDSLPTAKAAPKSPAKPLKETEQKEGKSGKTPADGISPETVATWFKERPPVENDFTEVAGMAELKEKLLSCLEDVEASRVNERLKMDKVHGFILYGPAGSGKTFVTNAFIRELMADDEAPRYKYMFLSGGDIHQSLVGMSEKVVERAFLEAKQNAPCILFIDEIDSVCVNKNLPNLPNHVLNTTTAFLNGYNSMLKSKKPIVFIGATNHPERVEGPMLDRVELIPVPLPDLEVRARTFELALKDILDNEPGFTYEDMAEETDNYSQRDCNRLLNMLKRSIKNDLRAVYGSNGDAMVEAMDTKQYRLRRQLFMDTLKNCNPSPKYDLIWTLDEWEAKRGQSVE